MVILRTIENLAGISVKEAYIPKLPGNDRLLDLEIAIDSFEDEPSLRVHITPRGELNVRLELTGYTFDSLGLDDLVRVLTALSRGDYFERNGLFRKSLVAAGISSD